MNAIFSVETHKLNQTNNKKTHGSSQYHRVWGGRFRLVNRYHVLQQNLDGKGRKAKPREQNLQDALVSRHNNLKD
jgi:hypothetical protein